MHPAGKPEPPTWANEKGVGGPEASPPSILPANRIGQLRLFPNSVCQFRFIPVFWGGGLHAKPTGVSGHPVHFTGIPTWMAAWTCAQPIPTRKQFGLKTHDIYNDAPRDDGKQTGYAALQ